MEGAVRLGVFVLFSLTLVADCIVWKSCNGGSKGKPTAVKINGCDHDNICKLTKGTNATFEVLFDIHEDAKAATAVVHGIISGVPVPFPPDNPDGCKNSGLQCPLKNGSSNDYSTYIFVRTQYPTLKLVVRWQLIDENKNDIFCVEVPVQIVDAAEDNRIKL